jgi:putative flavoprotein involved in K+ transport
MITEEDVQLIEEGDAAHRLIGRIPAHFGQRREAFDVIVIGGGQAGLSVGYHLARTKLRFVILDAQARVGDAWRKRWDSLRLFTPAKYDGLDGMPFPSARNYFPTKDEMANYLDAYAKQFQLPVRNATRVERLFKRGERYVVCAGAQELEARHVVVAMAKYQRPQIPDFASELSGEIMQMHSMDYQNPRQLKPGAVLLVGAGNSGADLALELARAGHKIWMAGPDTGQVPFRPEGFWGRNLFAPLVIGFMFHHVLTVNTPMGRKARANALSKGVPLIRVKQKDLSAAGIVRVPRVTGVRDGQPLLEDGSCPTVANVIWCNGFNAGFDWIELPVFDDHGMPRHRSGLVESESGLYFVGLPFLHAMSSSMINGVSRDAARIVKAIEERLSPVGQSV